MSDERTKILQMLSDGKITAEEAADLIDASAPLVRSDVRNEQWNEVQPAATETVATKYSARDDSAKPKVRRIGIGGRWINFANNLERMRCEGANFDKALFFANNLERANFCDADATNAKFFAVNVDSAIFEGANLNGARILCSNLDGANFRNANLEGVLIFGANFDSVNMEGADLSGQSFIATNMEGFNAPNGHTLDLEPSEAAIVEGPISHI